MCSEICLPQSSALRVDLLSLKARKIKSSEANESYRVGHHYHPAFM
jgi:hypothetical protein